MKNRGVIIYYEELKREEDRETFYPAKRFVEEKNYEK